MGFNAAADVGEPDRDIVGGQAVLLEIGGGAEAHRDREDRPQTCHVVRRVTRNVHSEFAEDRCCGAGIGTMPEALVFGRHTFRAVHH
ncbi:hypothetical protein OG800_19500 [Streptomyces sp. NBC_00445]|uniref:hypothetical protein n=1 Tax=Streptomyces sp. NBC_00445 TaxID=2975745 RepID=UPI002E24A38E